MKLVSQVNGDGDIIEAWLRHYIALGVDEFLIILHGSDRENEVLLGLLGRYPVTIVDRYEAEYSPQEKCDRQNAVIDTLRGQWIMVVDSDEFVELPFRSAHETVRVMQLLFARALPAPMLQRTTASGTLASPDIVHDVDSTFPLCVPNLYKSLRSDAVESKYPLFRCDPDARVRDGGNHIAPVPLRRVEPPLLGVTHHYKWRPILRSRLESRIASSHTWKYQSENYLGYLAEHAWVLPVGDGFHYSRGALFDRDLLRRPEAASLLRYFTLALKAKVAAPPQSSIG